MKPPDELISWLNLHPWPATAAAAILALLVVLVVHRIGMIIAERVLPETTPAGKLVRRTATTVEATLAILALLLVWHGAPDNLPFIHPARHITLFLLILSCTWLIDRFIAASGQIFEEHFPATIADNLHARTVRTQLRVLSRSLIFLMTLAGLSAALMTVPSVRHIGTSLLASAGIAGLAAGIAAKSMLGNLLAGLQLAVTQPIRIDDVLIVDNEWGRVEEITMTYVVVHIWDDRRLIVPLQWFIEHPFQNWTRRSSWITGSVFLWVDYRLPLEPLRAELKRLVEAAPEYDRRFFNLQVTDASEHSMQLRALMTSADSSKNWDLRCRVREGMIAFIRREYPDCLPLSRIVLSGSAPTHAPEAGDGEAKARLEGGKPAAPLAPHAAKA